MSLEIKINIPDFGADGFPMQKAALLEEDMAAIGFYRGPQRVLQHAGEVETSDTPEATVVGKAPASAPVEEVAEKAPAKRGRKAKEADPEPEARNISANPENRVDPAQAEADAKQDAEDEAAEVEAKRDPKKPLTVEDVRNAMTAYVTAYGLPATQEDGPLIFTEALGAPPAGESYWKLSLLPDDQDKLQRVVDTWAKALELNPKKRARVS